MISLVTISFNQAPFLSEMIESVRCQLGSGDEHIVVDPGSTDGSRRILEAYARSEKRVKAIFDPDHGPADGLNRGFALATGEILGFINSDDFLLRGALAYTRKRFRKDPNLDVLIGAIKLADGNGHMKWRGRTSDKPSVARLSSGHWQYYQQGTFFRRRSYDAIGGFNTTNHTCWDRELIVDMIMAGARCRTTARPLGGFRLHSGTITSGGASPAYRSDCLRIEAKVRNKFVPAEQSLLGYWLRAEGHLNLLRLFKQLWPAAKAKA